MAVYDLAVVGAGPGGAAASIAAARQGLKVVLFEKRKKGRDKYCGGGLCEASLSTLKILGVDELDLGFVTEGYGFVIHGESILVTAVKGHIGMTVRRCDLDKILMERAEDEDVEFKEKTEIVRIKEKDNEVVLTDNRGENYRSRYLVLATGMEERLILSLGFPPLPRETLGQCWGTEKPYNVDEQVVKWRKEYGITPIWIFMGGVGISYGYFWVFPKKGFMNVGMGVLITEAKRGLHEKGYKAGLELARKLGILDDTSPFKIDRGWIIPSKPRSSTYSVDKKTVLVGDAAGFLHPVLGEGISVAMKSGIHAARVIKEALDKNDPVVLKKYKELWWRDFGREYFEYGAKLSKLMYSHPWIQKMGFKGIMADDKAVRLLALMLYDPTKYTSAFYNYTAKNILALAFKALTFRDKKKVRIGA